MDCYFWLQNPGRGEGAALETLSRGARGAAMASNLLLHLECQIINNQDSAFRKKSME